MRKNGLNNIVVSLTKELFFVFLPFFVDFFKVLQHSSKITKFAENYRKSFSTFELVCKMHTETSNLPKIS